MSNLTRHSRRSDSALKRHNKGFKSGRDSKLLKKTARRLRRRMGKAQVRAYRKGYNGLAGRRDYR